MVKLRPPRISRCILESIVVHVGRLTNHEGNPHSINSVSTSKINKIFTFFYLKQLIIFMMSKQRLVTTCYSIMCCGCKKNDQGSNLSTCYVQLLRMQIQKRKKRSFLFLLLGSALIKCYKMLVKSTPGLLINLGILSCISGEIGN